MVCWLRLRVSSLARKAVVSQRAVSGAPTNSGAPGAPATPPAGGGRGRSFVGLDWAAALELTIATNGAEPYKSRLKELFPQMITPEQMDFNGWKAVRALPYSGRQRERSNARSGEDIHGWAWTSGWTRPRSACPRASAPGADRAPWSTWPSECISCTRRFRIS